MGKELGNYETLHTLNHLTDEIRRAAAFLFWSSPRVPLSHRWQGWPILFRPATNREQTERFLGCVCATEMFRPQVLVPQIPPARKNRARVRHPAVQRYAGP
jgi:hypothetical protein